MFTKGQTYFNGNGLQVNSGIGLCQRYLADVTSDDVILDLGCGTGEITQYLAKFSGAKVTGLDVNADMIEFAMKTHNADNILYDVTDLQNPTWFLDPRKQQLYTYAICFRVLHWIPNIEAVLQNIYRVLAPEGRLIGLILTQPNLSPFKAFSQVIARKKWTWIPDKFPSALKTPLYQCILESGQFDWMENISSFRQVLVSSGFSIEFIKTEEYGLNATKDVIRPVIPVLQYLTPAQQEEFMEDFLDIATEGHTISSLRMQYLIFAVNKKLN